MAHAGLISVSTVIGRGVARMHDVAGVDLAEAGASVDRRGDGGKAQLRLGALDAGLVGLDGGLEVVDLGLLLVDGLLRAGALTYQVLKAGEVLLIGDELGLVLGALGLGLVEHRGERSLIDDGKRVALLDLLAFDEIHAGSLPSTWLRMATVLEACTVPRPSR